MELFNDFSLLFLFELAVCLFNLALKSGESCDNVQIGAKIDKGILILSCPFGYNCERSASTSSHYSSLSGL